MLVSCSAVVSQSRSSCAFPTTPSFGESTVAPKLRSLRTGLYSISGGRGQTKDVLTSRATEGGLAPAPASLTGSLSSGTKASSFTARPVPVSHRPLPAAGSSHRLGRAADMGPRQPRCGPGSR
ncbi:hypothetical protein NN561_018576 [Cricetulus griseus]